MSGVTRSHADVAMLAAELAPSLESGLYPHWQAEIVAWTILVDCYAPDAPDAATAFTAASCIMGLTRTAADAASLKLLRCWLDMGFAGNSTADMIARTVAWSKDSAAARLRMLDVIERLAADLERDVTGCTEADDVGVELEDVRQELADLRANRSQPTLTSLSWLSQSRVVRAFAKACRSFVRTYPMRAVDPLNTLERVNAARAAIARRAQ